jgi:hypothetical protein
MVRQRNWKYDKCPFLQYTTSIPKLKAYFLKKKSQTKSSLTKLLEESIKKYDIL